MGHSEVLSTAQCFIAQAQYAIEDFEGWYYDVQDPLLTRAHCQAGYRELFLGFALTESAHSRARNLHAPGDSRNVLSAIYAARGRKGVATL